MEIRFDGKVIVVIGGSTGIGKATVKLFLESGGQVIFTGIEEEKEIDLDEYSKYPDESYEYKQLDITDEEGVKKFASYVKKKWSGCDVLFNNAGILEVDILHETPTEKWLRVMDVNVNGFYYTSKYFIPQMIEKGGGVIVNTSSMSGLQADYAFCAYNASKGAVANLTRNMALDYAPYNIRVNAVAPGNIKTPMYEKFAPDIGGIDILDLGVSMVKPMKRHGLPEEIGNAVLFLASDKASFITGVNLLVDGGLTAHTGAQHNWEMVKVMRNYLKEKGKSK